MVRRLLAFAAFAVVLGGALSVYALPISTSTTNLRDVFPRNAQGQNGIYIEYRPDGTSTYVPIPNASDYRFTMTDTPWSVPDIGQYYNWVGEPTILAAPSDEDQNGVDRDTVIRVQLEGCSGQVRVEGDVMVKGGSVRFYIYKGAANWASPLWSGDTWNGHGGTITGLTIDFQDGDELFFSTDAGVDDKTDGGQWRYLRLTGLNLTMTEVPEPGTILLFVTGVAGLAGFARRRRK